MKAQLPRGESGEGEFVDYAANTKHFRCHSKSNENQAIVPSALFLTGVAPRDQKSQTMREKPNRNHLWRPSSLT